MPSCSMRPNDSAKPPGDDIVGTEHERSAERERKEAAAKPRGRQSRAVEESMQRGNDDKPEQHGSGRD